MSSCCRAFVHSTTARQHHSATRQRDSTTSPQHDSTTTRDKGAVLVVVLWILFAMSLLALSFSASIRTEVDAARNVVDQKQSYYLARAGIEYAIYKVIESQMAFAQIQRMQQEGVQSLPPVLTGSVDLSMPNGSAKVKIIDETGKINVNLAPSHLIYNLLIMVSLDEQEADVITDSIEDWRDPDDLHRPNGAESDYYQSLPEPYFAKNSVFDVPEELLLVRGITPEIYYGRKGMTEAGEKVEYYGLQNYFTTFTRINRINVNSAPLPVLAALPGLDYEAAAQIYSMRQEAPILNVTEILERIPGIATDVAGLLSTTRLNVYTLISDGRLTHSEAVNRIRCVVRIEPRSPKGYAVLYWNESNIEL
ncbi:type II secretion system protein GspK [Acidobacteria bacterium AH-259-L09]|nr:type II secretion system protein GspK [Acidobacteria bacterium AH-259-L09]